MNNYTKYLLKRLFWYLLTFVIAVSLNFLLPRMIKGNPVSVIVSNLAAGMADSNAQKRLYETFMKEFGLNQSLFKQYLIYWGNLLHGNLGTSFSLYPKTVSSILASALPWTIMLQLPAILVGWIVGNLLGALTAYKRGIYEKTIFPLSLFINSIPSFALSIILLYFFAVHLKWFPTGGGYDYNLMPSLSWQFISSVLYHYPLPFLSIVLVMIGGQAIGMRSMSIYELNADYVLYSKLMGVSDSKIVRYVFKNAVLPQITGLALSLGTMVSGALITEIVFNYPGIGTWMFTAIRQLDYPLISGCTLMITIAVLAANFLIEIIYGLIDPRVKAAQMEEG
mgnify:CR=1 FL=1